MATGFPIIFGGGARGPWTPEQLQTALWLDAADSSTITLNGSNVSQWSDKSGNGRNFGQSTAALQPAYSTTGLNGKPQLQFASDALTFTGSIPVAGVSAFIVGRLLSTTPANRGIWSATNGTNFDTAPGGNIVWSSGFSSGIASGADAYYNAFGSGTINVTLPMNKTYVYNYVSTQGIYTNGTLRFSGNNGSAAITLGFMTLGGRSSGTTANNLSNCEMSEIIYCPSVLSTANRQLIEGYLAWKWGGF